MSSYLHSCLKVPINPSNNCPAPTFNRPKTYLGCLSATPNTLNSAAEIPKHGNETERLSKWSCGGIRSLAKLYDSIPDYRDLTHLSGEEFYSTLNALRSTCRELKFKTNCFSSEHRCSSTTTTTSTSLASSNNLCQLEGSRSKKCKKSKKKKKSTQIKNYKNNFEAQIFKSHKSDFTPSFRNAEKHDENFHKTTSISKVNNSSLSKSSEKDFDKEVESFKKSLQEFEAEYKRPLTSSSKDFVTKNHDVEYNKEQNEKVPIQNALTSTLRERLGKSLSFNDLHSLTEPPELAELRKKNKTLELLSFKGASNSEIKDSTKLSNYFRETPPSTAKATESPKFIVESPTNRLQARKKSKQKGNKNEEYKMAFELFNLDAIKKEKSIKHSTPSPIHPVARPNLAATLRAESSKKKVKELKNNCTYHDTTAQFDWEVRKTPAWKTLSLNETHKQILQLRLATRKAEQVLQQREYELNMELMRQRVKSAPLLLEGPTYFGSHVGKLSHACQNEGRRHMCQTNHKRTRRRKNSSRSQSCRRNRMLFNDSSTAPEENCNSCTNMFRSRTDLSNDDKLNAVRKIYGAKSQSPNSNHSTNTQQSLKYQSKTSVSREQKKSQDCGRNSVAVGIDSGDEISSLDRAFL